MVETEGRIMPFDITNTSVREGEESLEESLEEPLLTPAPEENDPPQESNAAANESLFLNDSPQELNDITTPSRYQRSLARSPTTSWLATLLIPLLALGTHALFLYGQHEPMWRLTQKQHVNVWANASSFETKQFFDTVGLHHNLNVAIDQDTDVKTFTYTYAMQELWRAHGMPGKFFPRLAAVLLALFSGVWPHLKLLLLNLTWLVAKHPVRRTRTLTWLANLGKWSLADVLVVCVMVGVLNLDWDVDPEQIRQGFSDQLPTVIGIVSTLYTPQDICKEFLHYSCLHPSKLKHKIHCAACLNGIETAFNHPSWAGGTGKKILEGVTTSGGGSVQLRVEGMKGIYAFCLAVVVSICLSLVVDVFDSRARRSMLEEDMEAETEERAQLMRGEGSVAGESSAQNELDTGIESPSSNGIPTRPSLQLESGAESSEGLDAFARAVESGNARQDVFSWSRVALICPAIIVLATVVCACMLPTMERRVNGALPHLLHDILGIVWTRPYSLSSLVRVTGEASGWDLLLMATFSLFVVFGPILRASLCVFGLVTKVPRRMQGKIRNAISFIGAFCASEVFVVAVFMVDLLMPAITTTIINTPQCAEIYPGSPCLEVEFLLKWKTFGLIIVGGALLVLVANLVVQYGLGDSAVRRRRRTNMDMVC